MPPHVGHDKAGLRECGCKAVDAVGVLAGRGMLEDGDVERDGTFNNLENPRVVGLVL